MIIVGVVLIPTLTFTGHTGHKKPSPPVLQQTDHTSLNEEQRKELTERKDTKTIDNLDLTKSILTQTSVSPEQQIESPSQPEQAVEKKPIEEFDKNEVVDKNFYNDIGWDPEKAAFEMQNKYLPEQVNWFKQVDSEKVLKEINDFEKNSIPGKDLTRLTHNAENATRDIIGEISTILKHSPFQREICSRSNELIRKNLALAIKARSINTMSSDVASNVAAWTANYMNHVEELRNDNDKECHAYSEGLDLSRILVALGLKNDMSQAINRLQNLSKEAVEKNSTKLTSQVNGMMATLSQDIANENDPENAEELIEQIHSILLAAKEHGLQVGKTPLNMAMNSIKEKDEIIDQHLAKHMKQKLLLRKRNKGVRQKIHTYKHETYTTEDNDDALSDEEYKNATSIKHMLRKN